MAAGYVRQSSGLIVTGQTIQASHFNNEYNAIEAAFNGNTGHDHTGGSGMGPIIGPSAGGTVIFLGNTVGGTANTITLATTTPDTFALIDKYVLLWRPTLANTAAATINISGLGAVPIKNLNPSGYEDLSPGDLQPDQFSFLVYDDSANVFQSITTVFAFGGVTTNAGFTMDFESLFVRYVITAPATVVLDNITTFPKFFWSSVQAKGGDITLTPNIVDSVQGLSAGTSYTIKQGTTALIWISDDGKWYIDGTSNTQPVAAGGTGAITAAAARTNLGLVIGTDVQAFDSDLAALAANTSNGLWARTSTGAGSARTITGTANRLDVTNGDGVSGNPTLNISTGYVGQASITTLGTITTGVWNGTTLAIANGGTGQTTATAAFDALAPSQGSNSGKYLTTNGSTTSWGTIAAGFTDPGGNGIVVRTALNTSTARTITGTANEITVTNGDGVSGNPTLSLPTALTYTGKTVTGGTFTTPTINVNDADLSIRDNGDTSKIAKFECSGITTATTRTLTIPDVSGTITVGGVKSVSRQVFTGSGTYTPTSGMLYCDIEVVGSGGGGDSNNGTGGGGGGGGGFAKKAVSAATIGASQTVTIGSGGSANSTSAGGTSSVGAIASATGGVGTNGPVGGAGGSGSSGDFNFTGDAGTTGASPFDFGEEGGNSFLGIGGGRRAVSSANGNNGRANTGGGASGAGSGATGGSGGSGIVIITEYLSV